MNMAVIFSFVCHFVVFYFVCVLRLRDEINNKNELEQRRRRCCNHGTDHRKWMSSPCPCHFLALGLTQDVRAALYIGSELQWITRVFVPPKLPNLNDWYLFTMQVSKFLSKWIYVRITKISNLYRLYCKTTYEDNENVILRQPEGNWSPIQVILKIQLTY